MSRRRGQRTSLKTAAAVIGVGLVLAGCSSSPKSPPVPKTATTTSTTATTLPPATTTTAAQAAQPCTTTGVSVTSSSSQGAAGTLVQRFIVTNTTAAPCGMNGAPFISPYGPQPQGGGTVEADLPITVGPIPAGFGDLGGSGGQIVVAAGQTAVFFLKWSDVTSASGPCYKADGFDFRTPQDTNSKLVTFSFPSDICGGTLEVSQILAPSVTG